MLEGLSCVGGYVLCWRLCLVLEGISCVGGCVLCWRVCLVLECMSCVGVYVLCWRVCLVLEAMSCVGGYVLVRMFPFSFHKYRKLYAYCFYRMLNTKRNCSWQFDIELAYKYTLLNC